MDEEITINELWDYSNPALTRDKFQELQTSKYIDKKETIHLILVTQIARTYGLEHNFEEGHQLLDSYLKFIEQSNPLVKTYYQLERGRLYNSDKEYEDALNHFYRAWDLAKTSKFDRLAVDAAHMIAIADSENSIKWNDVAIEYAEQSEDESAKSWLGSLYNNQGWSYHDIGEYQKAMQLFEKALTYFQNRGNPKSLQIAKWTVGRAHRSLENIDEALQIMHSLEQEAIDNEEEVGMYVLEELGELYLIKQDQKKSYEYFNQAYTKFDKDEWFKNSYPKRFKRIKELATNFG